VAFALNQGEPWCNRAKPADDEQRLGPPARFAGVLRELRAEAGLRLEKLAEASRLSPRAISDLKRVLPGMRTRWAAR
jgi:hypothetical protein